MERVRHDPTPTWELVGMLGILLTVTIANPSMVSGVTWMLQATVGEDADPSGKVQHVAVTASGDPTRVGILRGAGEIAKERRHVRGNVGISVRRNQMFFSTVDDTRPANDANDV